MPRQVFVEHTFAAPWSATTTAFWNKYPHPTLPHVKNCFVLSRHIDSTGQLHTRRLIHVEQNIPRTLRPFTKLDSFFALETSVTDPHERTLKIDTENLTFANVVSAKEKIMYKENKLDAAKTDYSIEIEIIGHQRVPLVTKQIEGALATQSSKKVVKGLAAMEKLVAFHYNQELGQNPGTNDELVMNNYADKIDENLVSASTLDPKEIKMVQSKTTGPTTREWLRGHAQRFLPVASSWLNLKPEFK